MKTTVNVISAFAFAFIMYGCDSAAAQCNPNVNGYRMHWCNYGRGGLYYSVPPDMAQYFSREHFYGNRNPYRGQSVQQDYQYRQGYYGSQTYRAWQGW